MNYSKNGVRTPGYSIGKYYIWLLITEKIRNKAENEKSFM